MMNISKINNSLNVLPRRAVNLPHTSSMESLTTKITHLLSALNSLIDTEMVHLLSQERALLRVSQLRG